MILLKKACAAVLTLLTCLTVSAQRTAFYADSDAGYKTALELFDKKQFAQAEKYFSDYAQKSSHASLLRSDAQYYAAACAIELFHKDGEWQMRRFIEDHPENPKVNSAWFYLGKSAFRKKKFNETIENFEKVDLYQLDKDQLSELYFKRGYSYLNNGNNDKAKADLYEIKDVDNKYAHPANYYYSHIAYSEKNYETALAGFKRLVGNETFGSVVPYYITQIYFIEGKFDIVVKDAPALLKDSGGVQKADEINRMIGESYFNLKDYENAIPYLKKTSLGNNPQGNYALGYCYYKTGNCKNAIQHFEKATENRDSVAQNAWYHMADCYIRSGDKLKAKNAFYAAYSNDYDGKITEDALFSFAKLSYELDFSPYNEAVKAFSKYLREYPDSPHKDECYAFLLNVYSTTKNYDQAIRSIESLETIDPILKVTYQKLNYFKGVELFNNSDLGGAEKQFRKSLSINSDPRLNALSQYWLSEVSYLRKDYTTAIEGWKKFQTMNGALQLKEYDLSNYAMGYAFFQRKERSENRDRDDYANANISFRKFLLSKNVDDENKFTDATIRVADCYFMTYDYPQAAEYYGKAIAVNKMDVDYALYQKALCDGLNKKYNEKVTELKKIENRYPNSNYLAAALNEIADTYYNNLKDEENAIQYYNKILKAFPKSSFVANCYAQLGNIYFGRKQDDRALEYYDKFVKTDSKSDAAKEILESIKKIYTEKGRIDEMEKYFASIGNPLSENELEKKTYAAAHEAFYKRKSCDESLPLWDAYISKFPNGKYITEAQFNAAECAYSKNQFEKALQGYLFVIGRDRSVHSEEAYAKAAFMYYRDKKYAEALPLYLQLQEIAETPSNKSAGRLGAMRSAFYLGNFETALSESSKVLSTEKLSPQQTSDAKYIKAKSLYETGRLDDALAELRNITKNAKNVTGAEAYYLIGKIQFKKQDYREVEKTVNKLISYEYSNDDWRNRGMLLLADAYIAKGDLADAQVILESIIEGKPKEDYLKEAQQRLSELKAQQSERSQNPDAKKDMKVDFKGTQGDQDLFDKLYDEYQDKNKQQQPK